jgi:hypothetical protein
VFVLAATESRRNIRVGLLLSQDFVIFFACLIALEQ